MKLKLFEKSVLIALIIAIFLGCIDFSNKCENIRNSVFRLHILANSDSEYDQQLKLKVRDKLLQKGLMVFEDSKSLEQTISIANENVDSFLSVAKQVLRENACDYDVSAKVTDAYFDTRTYQNTTLPAGEYKALQIKIGTAKGKNWWCVMYPSICISAATTDEVLESQENDIVSNKPKYQIRFKIVEWFEALKHYIN